MEFEDLKQSMEKIEMSDEMRNRIIRNCRLWAVHETEKITMKNKTNFNFKKVGLIAAAVALCLCISVAAVNHFGQFKDIKNWNGAVTGTEYVQATNEIQVSAAADQDGLIITSKLLTPDIVPYRELDDLGIGGYKIVDVSGNVIIEGEGEDFAPIIDGQAVMAVSLDGVNNGDYRLLVSAFIGYKKADQPLKISGEWECAFTV